MNLSLELQTNDRRHVSLSNVWPGESSSALITGQKELVPRAVGCCGWKVALNSAEMCETWAHGHRERFKGLGNTAGSARNQLPVNDKGCETSDPDSFDLQRY